MKTPTEERKPLYSVGDLVEIVNYGSEMWLNKAHADYKNYNPEKLRKLLPVIKETEDTLWLDLGAQYVGKQGNVDKVEMHQGIPSYAIHFEEKSVKHAWYHEQQMKLIKRAPKPKKNEDSSNK